jgi:hypothetical protein
VPQRSALAARWEIRRTALGGKGAVKTARENSLWPHVVMCRHDEMRQQALFGLRASRRLEFGNDAIRSEIA